MKAEKEDKTEVIVREIIRIETGSIIIIGQVVEIEDGIDKIEVDPGLGRYRGKQF